MQARRISYLRCAAYFRPLPRTHQQQKQLLAQTHSRGRTMLASITEIRLPPCLGVFPIFVPFTRRHRVPRMHTSWWHNIRYVACADLHRVKNGWLFHSVNRENEKSCQEKRFSERLIFTRFCANGKRPAFIGVGSERDKTEAKRR